MLQYSCSSVAEIGRVRECTSLIGLINPIIEFYELMRVMGSGRISISTDTPP